MARAAPARPRWAAVARSSERLPIITLVDHAVAVVVEAVASLWLRFTWGRVTARRVGAVTDTDPAPLGDAAPHTDLTWHATSRRALVGSAITVIV